MVRVADAYMRHPMNKSDTYPLHAYDISRILTIIRITLEAGVTADL